MFLWLWVFFTHRPLANAVLDCTKKYFNKINKNKNTNLVNSVPFGAAKWCSSITHLVSIQYLI